MKNVFVIVALMTVGFFAKAESVLVASQLPQRPGYEVQSFFRYNSSSERAWVQVRTLKWNGENYTLIQDQQVTVKGLEFNADAKQVIYTKTDGATVVCGTKSLFATNHLKLTGNCVLELTSDESGAKVYFRTKP